MRQSKWRRVASSYKLKLEMNNNAETSIVGAIKKILKWGAALAIVVSILISVITAVIFAYEKYKTRPVVVTTLFNIQIGAKFNDVMFKNSGYKKVDEAKFDVEGDPKSKEIRFKNETTGTTIFFENNLVVKIKHACPTLFDGTTVSEIKCGHTSEKVEKRFGKDVRIFCIKNGLLNGEFLRAYDVPKYGIRYVLWENSVVGFLITDPLKMILQFNENWVQCD